MLTQKIEKKIKVIWISNFSNSNVREHMTFSLNFFEKNLRKVFSLPNVEFIDNSVWISNGIDELKNNENIDLHVISPHHHLKNKTEFFELEKIKYYFYKPEDDYLINKILSKVFKFNNLQYKKNRLTISSIIESIKPDIIHMYGAENPIYSISAFDIDTNKYPFLVTLQTLMNDDEFIKNYPISEDSYNYRSKIEKAVLQKTTYLASSADKYIKIVWKKINSRAIFFRDFLALSEKPKEHRFYNVLEKQYDFVYFAKSISKAGDIAIEAFAIACRKHPNLSLNIIGGTPEPFTSQLKIRIDELGIKKNVIFSGQLATHDEVLSQIRLSKYAILPIKIDIITGTIREAMFNKIPVVTTITSGTPLLNEKRESVLLSEKEDYEAIAQNMITLVENPNFAEKIAENAEITVKEIWSNKEIMDELVIAYQAILNHFHHNIGIDKKLIKQNNILQP